MNVSIETLATTRLSEDDIMRNRLSFSKMLLGIGLIGLTTSWASIARADLRWVETVEVLPTASVVAVPRTYLVPSTYVVPTTVVGTSSVIYPTTVIGTSSVIYPTSTTANVYRYVPTTYYAPTSYVVPRSYRSYRAFRPRRYVETTYIDTYPTTLTPTYYVSPTTYLSSTSYVTSTGLLATSIDICGDVTTAPAYSAPTNAGNGANSGATSPKNTQKSTDAGERRPGATLDSVVAEEPDYRIEPNQPVRDGSLNTTQGSNEPVRSFDNTATGSEATRETLKPSNVTETPKPAVKPLPRPETLAKPKDAAPVNEASVIPPPPRVTPPATSKDTAKKPSTADTKIPIAPPTPPIPSDPDPINPSNNEPPPIDSLPALPAPGSDEPTRRDARKPVYPSNNLIRPKRNVLEGKIVSADSLSPEENVEVVITDRSGRYIDRTARTNAFGEFAITLPEGDWTIKVTMPSGRTLAVGQGEVTASAGKIIDMYGRDLRNLVIKR
jgi:hypothetical protein